MVRDAGDAPTRTRRARGSHRAAVGRPREESAFVPAGTTAVQDRHVPGVLLPEPVASPPPAPGPAPRPLGRRALKNWRVRSRLVLLVIIPTLTAVVGGGFFIASSVHSAVVDGRVVTLASLSSRTTGLVQALQTERQDTVRYIVLGDTGGGRGTKSNAAISAEPELTLLAQDYATTNRWASQVKTLAGGVGGSDPAPGPPGGQ